MPACWIIAGPNGAGKIFLSPLRHPGRNCRGPGYKDVLSPTIRGLWIPAFPAGMTDDITFLTNSKQGFLKV